MSLQSKNVILLDRFGNLDQNLPEALRAKGYRSEISTDLKEAIKKARNLTKPILFIDGGRSQDLGLLMVRELLLESEIKSYPIVLTADGVSHLEAEVRKVIPAFNLVHAPAKTLSIITGIEAVEHISQKFTFLKPTPEVTTSIPPFVFDEIARLNLENRPLGGNLFAKVNSQGAEGRIIEPISTRVKKVYKEKLEKATPRWNSRFQRINYVTECLANALDLNTEQALQLSSSYSCSFIDGPEEFLTKDYLGSRRQAFRAELCSRIKDSAMEVGFQAGDEELAQKILNLAKAIGQEHRISSDEIGVVIAADIIDRVCTRRGHFNPRVTYDFLRRVRFGILDWIPTPIIAVLIKFISESIAASATKLLQNKKFKLDPLTRQKISEIIAEPLRHDEAQVGISDLSPGMMLSKPIHAFDGAQVLEGGLKLDEDLVMRIWQLASIRPLIDPTVKK